MLTTPQQPEPVEPQATSQDAPEAAPSETPTAESGIHPRKDGKYQRISVGMKLRVMELDADGLTPTQIAKTLGISHQRVCDITAQHGGIKQRVQQVLNAQRVKAAEAWGRAIPKAAKKGDHRPARELLIATGDVTPLESTGSGVSVIVNMPGSQPQMGAKVVGSASTLDNAFVIPSPQVVDS